MRITLYTLERGGKEGPQRERLERFLVERKRGF